MADARDAARRGREAEDRIADRLRADGWSVLARNWRGADGELDLVVERDGVVRFVEVKGRDEHGAVQGIDALTANKRGRLVRAAEAWLGAHGRPARECAFLVAVVDLAPGATGVDWWDDPF